MNSVRPVSINGHEYYVLPIHPPVDAELKRLLARNRWKQYYRCVRILRSIRRADIVDFHRCRAWWEGVYKHERSAMPPELRGILRSYQPRKLP